MWVILFDAIETQSQWVCILELMHITFHTFSLLLQDIFYVR